MPKPDQRRAGGSLDRTLAALGALGAEDRRWVIDQLSPDQRQRLLAAVDGRTANGPQAGKSPFETAVAKAELLIEERRASPAIAQLPDWMLVRLLASVPAERERELATNLPVVRRWRLRLAASRQRANVRLTLAATDALLAAAGRAAQPS